MLRTTSILALCFLFVSTASAAEFQSNWDEAERVWIGPEYWANPLQDWRLANGRIENTVSGGNRNTYLLTHELGEASSAFEMSVRLGKLEVTAAGWAGFRIGIGNDIDEYRYSALRGTGLNIGVTSQGKPFIGDDQAVSANRRRDRGVPLDDAVLTLTAEPRGAEYRLRLTVGGRRAEAVVPAEDVAGYVALVSEPMTGESPTDQNSYGPQSRRAAADGDVRFWFRDWRMSGDKVVEHLDRAWGPLLWAQHTLSRGVMKMSAQLPPMAVNDAQSVRLQIKRGVSWQTIDEEQIHTLARTATFRITDWDDSRDVEYRLAYEFRGEDVYWTGTVRKNPKDKEEIVVAAFTGNKDTAFPNVDNVRNVEEEDPDVLFFSGDQIYEDVAGFGIERLPVPTASLDYLRKWWLVGWSFGDLMRDRVTVHMPDDHDVYQGNIWGGGGPKQPLTEHERGGYVMAPEWVNVVQRTQTSHMPDPYDPRPIEQGIGVYYGELNYGRVSFGIIEDRKFKSGPKGITPETGGRPDHVTNPNYNPADYDAPGAKLLGDRQLAFIRDWTSNWSLADFKVSLTQSVFANAATTHGANMMRLVADLDSNGWPQSGRNRALNELRKGFTFMIGGDQHLPSIIHHGIDEFSDAGYSFCVPSISAGYPRSYEPEDAPVNRPEGAPHYAGDRRDGLGNMMTIYAVANPIHPDQQRKDPLGKLHDKASGYGIVRLNKRTRKISMECWKLLTRDQFEGWPMTIDQTDNYGREAAGYLPTVRVTGLANPVIQVVDEESGDPVYTLRISGSEFAPKVFRRYAQYTLRVGEPETGIFREFPGLGASAEPGVKAIEIAF